ncbi:hypothetical protein QBC42DRAFT_345873 [Cladorrhinum samala]|uniref:ABM domain-containing protein n=1 Tax=Cladorrhinum samala TaxID=585594 RepID=A0AAV9HTB8_9PEZI|nr:hypothetical protein QBC42DRAFT_345873 [Cladorrhinum samala]
MPLYFLAILEPKPDRTARLKEICQSVADHVKENEPGVLKYQWFLSGPPEKPKIYVWEIYKDQEAIENHKKSSKMAWLVEIEQKENNLLSEIQVVPLEEIAGWAGRD